MNSLRDILEAIRALPRPDRLRLAERLQEELESEHMASGDPVPPPASLLELEDGFYVYTGDISAAAAMDHRADREERIDQLIARVDARRA
jgi:hypothetical protein